MRHWRRHHEAADNCVAATACGRLVDVDDVSHAAENSDCPDCLMVNLFAACNREDLARIIHDYNKSKGSPPLSDQEHGQ